MKRSSDSRKSKEFEYPRYQYLAPAVGGQCSKCAHRPHDRSANPRGRHCRWLCCGCVERLLLPTVTSNKYPAPMSQSSATESDHSDLEWQGPLAGEMPRPLSAQRSSQSSDNLYGRTTFEFDDLIYDLAQFFLTFKGQMEFQEWVYTVCIRFF